MLPNHLAIYVPSNANGQRLPAGLVRHATESVITRFVHEFNGCTVRPAVGYWRSDSGLLVVERVRIVEACSDRPPAELRAVGLVVAEELADLMQQECAAYVVNGTMRFAAGRVAELSA